MQNEIKVPLILAILTLLFYVTELALPNWVMYVVLLLVAIGFLYCFVILTKEKKKIKIGKLSLNFLITEVIVFFIFGMQIRGCQGFCGITEGLTLGFLILAQICILIYSGWLNYQRRKK